MSEERIIETPAPADRPTFTILTEGEEINPAYQVMAVSIKRAVNRIATATIIILDGKPAVEDFPVSNTDDFLPGKTIEIQAGYHSEESPLFKGVVIRQRVRSYKDKPATLRIECKDAAVKLTVGRKSKYFYESTDSEIIEEIAGGAGLSVDVEPTSLTHQEMVQYNATDWDFIVSRADINGQLVYTGNGTLRVAKPDLSQPPSLSLLYGGNLLDFEAEMDARYQYEQVNAFAWSPASQELLAIEGAPPSGDFPGNVDTDRLAAVIGLDSFDLRHAGQVKDTELQGWADAQLQRSRLAKVRGRCRIQGISDVAAGQIIEVGGMGDRFNGPVFVAGVYHELNRQNWETQIEFGLSPEWFSQETEDIAVEAAHGLLPAVNGLQIGLVTALEGDPEGEDRIQVRIPMISPQEEGVWARVASLDAGGNRGAVFRPEIGDEVILGFLDDDPRNPIVLGMVHSSAKPAPIAASDDNHEKGFVTRSEMKVIFNDDEVSLTIETPNGNKLLLSDQDGGITLEDENGNKIVLDSNGITLESAADISVKASGDTTAEGTNVTLSASANLKGEGSAGAELSSSGTTTVKGSLVQIN